MNLNDNKQITTPNHDYTEKEAQELYNKFNSSVYEFACHFFPHYLTAKVPDFHREIYDYLPRHQYIATEAPRGGAKSTLGLIIYPIWWSLFRGIGDISLVSRSESFVLNEISRRIRWEFENNGLINQFFGNLKTEKWSESYFTLANGVSFEGKGIEGQLRGGRRGLICLDDLEDNETVLSEEQRDKLRQRITKELIPKLLPKGQMIFFGTPIHQLCYLHQTIKTPNNGWFKKIYDAYKDGIEEKGHELWAEVLSHEELQKRKSIMGSTAFSAEYRCNPVSEENQPIKEPMIRYWDKLPAQYSCVIAVDPAYTDDSTSDYKVAVVVALDSQSNRYLLSVLRTHEPVGEFIDGILNLYQQHKGFITRLGAPCSGTEREFYRSLVNRATERKMFPPFFELKNTFVTSSGEHKRNKKSRTIAALQPLFETGKYYIAPYHQDAREELLNIGQSRWDDVVDAMAYAEQLLTPVFYDSNHVYEEEFATVEMKGDTGYGL